MVHDPDTWTTPHLLQLKSEYEILVDKYGCVVQETFTVQDPPAPPSDTLLLPPLKCLYKANERIQERPQPGDSRPVLPPSQRTLSRQIMRNWEPWTTNTGKSNNHRMFQQLSFHKQQTIKTVRVQDLDPSPCVDNAHESVLTHEMTAIEPSEIPSRTLTWKPLAFLNHIKRRSNDDRFSASQWESFFCSSLGVSTPTLLGPDQFGACNAFSYDTLGDHLQTCQTKSVSSQDHDWVVYKMGTLLGSVGHRVKIHKITPATGKEGGDIEIKDYVVMQKPQTQDNRLPPPHTMFMTDPDGCLKEVVRIKIRYYRNVYSNNPDPISFIPLAVDTTGRLYDFVTLKGVVGLIMAKPSVMRVTIPQDLSSRSFIPIPRFIRSRRPTLIQAPSLVFFPPRSA